MSTRPSNPPENLEVDLSNAKSPGLTRRLGAILYDSMLVSGVVFIAFALLYLPLAMGLGLLDISSNNYYRYLFFTYIVLVAMGFHLWFWTHGGQTLGMRTWRIKVFSEDGARVTASQALIRYLVAILSLLAFGLGFLWALFDKDKRCWHDIASGTRLVSVRKQKK